MVIPLEQCRKFSESDIDKNKRRIDCNFTRVRIFFRMVCGTITPCLRVYLSGSHPQIKVREMASADKTLPAIPKVNLDISTCLLT